MQSAAGGFDENPSACGVSGAILGLTGGFKPCHYPAVGLSFGVFATLKVCRHALGAKHGDECLGHLVADAAAVVNNLVRIDVEVDGTCFELFVIIEGAGDVMRDFLDVIELGLVGVPEFVGLCYGVGGIVVVTPGSGYQVGREVAVDFADVETVLVLDVVAFSISGVVRNGVLVFARAIDECHFDGCAFGYSAEGLFAVGAFEDEATLLALGREGDIALVGGRPIDFAVVGVVGGGLAVVFAGSLDGLHEGGELAVGVAVGDHFEDVLVHGLAVAGSAGDVAVGLGRGAGVLVAVVLVAFAPATPVEPGLAAGIGAGNLGHGTGLGVDDGAGVVGGGAVAAGGEADGHHEGEEQGDDAGNASRTGLHNYQSFL